MAVTTSTRQEVAANPLSRAVREGIYAGVISFGLFVLLVALGKAARYAVVIMGGLWAMT